ncbi:uncharacterized protein B0P05DRAFT_504262 [Gilbertella persicaria]|uniref:uncharacterized protein n=1 Tax=Gilbertella persicaria TaxID=101096 RepID=UPI0022210774|nr:uncharacterized protein B0P05DRAFT_504262 [Gilbertella persicaria]KAI8091470.1 hypothetical protein B0P05DRAFT_504262 [Gilbertella persicaria]
MLQSMYNSLSSHMYTDKKAPNSFSLFVTKRRNEQEGHYISIEQLTEEWQQMSKEQKAEFQNQSQCIQFTLDIDHRSLTDHKKPSISSSMIIPNDHSPVLHLFDHFQPPPTSSDQPTSPTFQKLNLSYSAAAEAAALESLSFNSHSVKQTTAIKRKYGILPEKVKRPPNAYLLFNRDMRRQLHDVNQGLSSGEISKTISMKWKQLSPCVRQRRNTILRKNQN